MRTLLDLVLPEECGGCGRRGTRWCVGCANSLSHNPFRVRPRYDPGVPCWALNHYSRSSRRTVLAAKERGRRDLADPIGKALAGGLARLRDRQRPLVLVPAPSRAVAARRRGGDPTLRSARVAAGWLSDCHVISVLRVLRGVRDSVGLSPGERAHNLHDRFRVDRVPRIAMNSQVVVVDDVLTTGATVTESVHTLLRAQLPVCAVLVTCCA